MKNLLSTRVYLLVTCFLVSFSCQSPTPQVDWSKQTLPLIPFPQQINIGDGQFDLNRQPIRIAGPHACQSTIDFLEAYLQSYQITTTQVEPGQEADILIQLVDGDTASEGYKLIIQPNQITFSAPSDAGIFYGVQTFRQMLAAMPSDTLAVPALSITDEPTFSWRGMHLDVSRHFFSVEFIKQYLDYLAMLKLNKFHWHLTDDQGWRIEIKQYPQLTAVGGFRDSTLVGHYHDKPETYDGERYGGFYTQAQIKEVVAYAAERHIEVIPEIEMPGHARAAIAAYPALGVTEDTTVRPWTKWGVSPYLFNVEESTFTFLENVLGEVISLFPSSYVHVGGDEAVKDQWETSPRIKARMKELGVKDAHDLQSYFMARIEQYLNANGRSMIGWDEIAERELAPHAVVMFWRGWLGDSGATQIIKLGQPVIMSPTQFVYFDYYQSQDSLEPLAIGGYLPLEKVYTFNPIPSGLPPLEAVNVLGGQANLWTEYIPTTYQAEYMLFPRVLALSEAVWTAADRKDYAQFLTRIRAYEPFLQRANIHYAPHGFEKP